MLAQTYRTLVAAAAALLIAACGGGGPSAVSPKGEVILATTTSTQDSGLLDVLLPLFERRTGWRVKAIAVGSGQALAMGRKGDVDVLLVHAPQAELQFMAEGFGKERLLVMHNDFVIVGPAADPAGVKVAPTAVEALRAIAAKRAAFMSRGDGSGTHALELSLWRAAAVTPSGQGWYQETGQGMGATLQIADQKAAYSIADRATYLAQRENLALQVLNEGDKAYFNVYHVITLNEERLPRVNAEGGEAFARFLVSAEAQAVIGTFGVKEYGQALFEPDAGKAEADLGVQ